MKKSINLPTHILVCDACGRSSIDPLPDVAMRWTFGGRGTDWATSPGAAHDLCPECVSQALAGVLAGILARRDAPATQTEAPASPPTVCTECGHSSAAHGPDGCYKGRCSCTKRVVEPIRYHTCPECGHSDSAHTEKDCVGGGHKDYCDCSKRAKDFEVPG